MILSISIVVLLLSSSLLLLLYIINPSITITTIIYKLLYFLLHLLYYQYKILFKIIPNYFCKNKIFKRPTNSLQVINDLKDLNKIPKHLGVIFWGNLCDNDDGNVNNNNDDDDYDAKINKDMELIKEVAELCCWCRCAGIKILSIYESEGQLKKYAQLLQSYIDKISHDFFISDNNKMIIPPPTLRISSSLSPSSASSPPPPSSSSNNNIKDDYYNKPVDLQINLISRTDGRNNIIETIKSLAVEVKLKKIKNDEIDVGEFDRRLSTPQFPEPQLLILFSPKIEIDGFPPWHIHLTEIFHVPNNKQFHYMVFIEGLRKYSKVDQRFGG